MPRRLFGNTISESAHLEAEAAGVPLNHAALSSPARQLWLAGLENLVLDLVGHTKFNANGCLEWIGPKDGRGYTRTFAFGKPWSAPRLFYFMWKGEIPPGHFVCHHCDNPKCVLPDHLFSGSQGDNIADACRKGRMRCARGEDHKMHKLTANNVQEIRRRYQRHDVTGNNGLALASEFGVHPNTISALIRGRTWKSIS